MGMAGSLSYLLMEVTFHFVDTVNTRTKVNQRNITSVDMTKKIYAKEGFAGFSKGISACFYGSIACGFIYFSFYKFFKQYYREFLGDSYNIAWTFFLASLTAEFITLIFYYPFDMFKCRLQTSNYIF
jgi:hypothetical protein